MKDIEVGETRIPRLSGWIVSMFLLKKFRRILTVKYTDREWKTVEEKKIKDFELIESVMNRAR